MKIPSMCLYAHGIKYLNKVNCKYGSNCCNPKCDFNHGTISAIPNMVYEILLFRKEKIKDNKIYEQINIPKKNKLRAIFIIL
jgi:hypothetical protein